MELKTMSKQDFMKLAKKKGIQNIWDKLIERHLKDREELLEFCRKNKDIDICQFIKEKPEEYVVSMKHCLKPTLIKSGKPSYTIKYYKKEGK